MSNIKTHLMKYLFGLFFWLYLYFLQQFFNTPSDMGSTLYQLSTLGCPMLNSFKVMFRLKDKDPCLG